MTALHLELVLEPAQRWQRVLAKQLQRAMPAGLELACVDMAQWQPHPCRLPGSAGQAPIALVLCSAAWCKRWPGAAATVLLLVEWSDGRAIEIGSALNWQALWHGHSAARFAVLTRAGATAWRPALQVAVPLLRRWDRQQQRFLRCAADTLFWWIALCEERQRLHELGTQATVAQPVALALGLGQRGLIHARWLLSRARARLPGLGHAAAGPWQVGIAQIRGAHARLEPSAHLGPCGDDWFADPFLISHDERTWLFCERWCAAKGKGVIDLFELTPTGLRACGTVLEEPCHLSFPRVIQTAHGWYATVESSSNGDVRLYRALQFPRLWRLERQLLRDRHWIDPLLIVNSDGCWLWVNGNSSPSLPQETAPALHLFYSPDLLRGTFEEHTASPQLLDSSCGRNGGLLSFEGQTHRVCQSTGIDNAYGAEVSLRRMDRLDVLSYSEQPWQPNWLLPLRAALQASHMHTLNNSGPWLAFDYRRAS